MRLGYIRVNNTALNPGLPKFEFLEATFTRRISSRSDRVYSKILACPVDYEDVALTAKMMKDCPGIIVNSEPFLLDDKLRDKVTRWVAWANQADPAEYDPFAAIHGGGDEAH